MPDASPSQAVDGRAGSLAALAAEVGWRPDVLVMADVGSAYATRVRDGTLEVIGMVREGTEWRVALGGSWDEVGGTNTVSINDALRTGTYISGAAEAGVARVVTSAPDAVGGAVIDGGWTVWSPDETLTEADDTIAWQFLAEDGSVVDHGTGWQWPFGSPFGSPPPPPTP